MLSKHYKLLIIIIIPMKTFPINLIFKSIIFLIIILKSDIFLNQTEIFQKNQSIQDFSNFGILGLNFCNKPFFLD